MCLPHLTEEKEEDQSVSRLSSSQILLPEVPKIIWIYKWNEKNPFFFVTLTTTSHKFHFVTLDMT